MTIRIRFIQIRATNTPDLSALSDEADQLSKNMACRLIRTSVKEDVNVSSVFRYLATKCFQLMRQYNNILPLEVPVISKLLHCNQYVRIWATVSAQTGVQFICFPPSVWLI